MINCCAFDTKCSGSNKNLNLKFVIIGCLSFGISLLESLASFNEWWSKLNLFRLPGPVLQRQTLAWEVLQMLQLWCLSSWPPFWLQKRPVVLRQLLRWEIWSQMRRLRPGVQSRLAPLWLIRFINDNNGELIGLFSVASCFESQKTVDTIKILVEMREKCFVQTKDIPIDVNFLLWKRVLLLIRLVWKFWRKFTFKNFGGGGGVQKRSVNCESAPFVDCMHALCVNRYEEVGMERTAMARGVLQVHQLQHWDRLQQLHAQGQPAVLHTVFQRPLCPQVQGLWTGNYSYINAS